MQGITRFYGLHGGEWLTHIEELYAVTDWGGIQWSSMENMFRYASNLWQLPISPPDTTMVTSMGGMFY